MDMPVYSTAELDGTTINDLKWQNTVVLKYRSSEITCCISTISTLNNSRYYNSLMVFHHRYILNKSLVMGPL